MLYSFIISGFFLANALAAEVGINDLQYFPTYNIGDALNVDQNYFGESSPKPPCIMINYSKGNEGYGTLIWRYPSDNTGEKNGRDLSGANKLTFWAKSDRKIRVQFFIGKFLNDTAYIIQEYNLTPEWQQYDIDMSGKDLTNIRGGFATTLDESGTIYLNDIKYIIQ